MLKSALIEKKSTRAQKGVFSNIVGPLNLLFLGGYPAPHQKKDIAEFNIYVSHKKMVIQFLYYLVFFLKSDYKRYGL